MWPESRKSGPTSCDRYVYKRKDSFYLRAKSEGYRSRAAYKLEELNRRYRLFRPGQRVIDLGAWPGGWLQVAAAAVGENGTVVGVDLQAISPFPTPNVFTIQGDVTQPQVLDEILGRCGGKADVVLSDLAPKLSGIRDRDEARGAELFSLATDFASRVLLAHGVFVAKLFMNPSTAERMAELRSSFDDVRTTRPEATRKGSAEIYIIAHGFRPNRTSTKKAHT